MLSGEKITHRINQLEALTKDSGTGFPKKLAAWFVILLVLMVTNAFALIHWPYASLRRCLKSKSVLAGAPLPVRDEEALKEILARHDRVLVDFWAEWCGPCLLMAKSLDTLAANHAGNLVVVKVDASISSKLAAQFGVKGLPTMILFKNGRETARNAGAMTLAQLNDFISSDT